MSSALAVEGGAFLQVTNRDRPPLHLHLTDRAAGLAQPPEALG